MAGYSGTPLPKKLGLEEGQRIALVGAPAGFRRSLDPIPAGIRWHDHLRPELDVVLLFAPDSAALSAALGRAMRSIAPAGRIADRRDGARVTRHRATRTADCSK